MPRYFLDIRMATGTVRDPEGVDLPDIEAARCEALRVAEDLREEDQ